MRLNKTCDLQMWDSVLNLEVLQMRETNWGKLFVNKGVQEIPQRAWHKDSGHTDIRLVPSGFKDASGWILEPDRVMVAQLEPRAGRAARLCPRQDCTIINQLY
jgi:hypothetical protein